MSYVTYVLAREKSSQCVGLRIKLLFDLKDMSRHECVHVLRATGPSGRLASTLG